MTEVQDKCVFLLSSLICCELKTWVLPQASQKEGGPEVPLHPQEGHRAQPFDWDHAWVGCQGVRQRTREGTASNEEEKGML